MINPFSSIQGIIIYTLCMAIVPLLYIQGKREEERKKTKEYAETEKQTYTKKWKKTDDKDITFLRLSEWFDKQVKPIGESGNIKVEYDELDKKLGIIKGGTKSLIGTIAKEKYYKCTYAGEKAAIFDVDFDRVYSGIKS